uniref:Biogenesis of lysosome-related organelles complex 1 subunit 5 n=1 Tax=Globodera rostochiensis TaxID=31243 RepID=A0A914HGN2_GLORO
MRLQHFDFIRGEIILFDEAFERNKRFKEFEGLIRTNHKVYESLDAKFDQQKIVHLNTLTNRLKNLSERMKSISEKHFTKDELDAFYLSERSTTDIVRKVELKQREIDDGRRD